MITDPDFTMSEECCAVANDARCVFQTGQVLSFESPVYVDTLNITVSQTSVNTVYIKDVDWTVNKSDIDTDTMSRLKQKDPAFNKVVVKSITSLRNVADGTLLNLSLKYQRVYPIRSKLILYGGEPVEWSADILRDILAKMNYLDALTSPIGDKHSTLYTSAPRLLSEDPNKENPANKITGEVHKVNVPGGKLMMHPVCGAFFKDSVVATYSPDGGTTIQTLVAGVDYIIEGVDLYRTGYTQNASGVYNFICLIKPYVGDVTISYHAYGGEATIYDQRILNEALNNIILWLNNNKFMTSDDLTDNPIIQQLVHTQLHIGENMRRLLNTGRPSYGDTTTGQTLLKKLSSVDDKVHWWTIASLYKVDTDMGSSEVVTADEFKFRLRSQNFNLMYDIAVSVNLNNEFSVMQVSTLNDCSPRGYTPFVDYSKVDLYPKPQLRVIYNKTIQKDSGVFLQIGMNLPGTGSDTIAIEDISGSESCWKLVNAGAGTDASPFQDDIVTLPNIACVWDQLNSTSMVESTLIPAKEGILIWAGAEPLNRPVVGKYSIPLAHFLDDSINIASISHARLEFEELGGNRFACDVPFVTGTEVKFGTTAFFYNGSSAYANVYIRRDTNKKLLVTVEADISAGTSANQLNLRHVFLKV